MLVCIGFFCRSFFGLFLDIFIVFFFFYVVKFGVYVSFCIDRFIILFNIEVFENKNRVCRGKIEWIVLLSSIFV